MLALSTLGAVLASNGKWVAAFIPTAAFLVAYTIGKVPLRYPALVVVFLVLTVDTPAEPFGSGKYESPFMPIAQVLMTQWKSFLPSGALVMTGMDVFLIGMLLVHGYRRAIGSTLDRVGFLPLPRPLIATAWLCVAGIMLALVVGLASGGTFRWAQWQVQRNIGLPLMLLVFQATFPSPDNYRPYLKVLIVAAHIRAVLAVILRFKFPHEEYVTSHSDSMLFATVTCMYLLRLILGATPREARRIWFSLSVLIAGMIQNERRLVWVELVFSLIFLSAMTPRTRFKVQVVRTVLVIIPFFIVYCAAGWGSNSVVFAPVAMIRSVVDAETDLSSLWRDLENFNLVATFAQHPVFGNGLGVGYIIARPMPDISNLYELEPYLPHNAVLGIWAYSGYFGFTMIWMILLVGMYFAARTFRAASERDDKVAALTTFACVMIYMLQCYGDMGLGSWISVCLVSPSLALVGKMAVKVGAWPRLGGGSVAPVPAAGSG